MSDPAFKPGDVVRLKSGGLPMTIHHTSPGMSGEGPVVHCCWHDATGRVLSEAFTSIMVAPVAAPPAVSPMIQASRTMCACGHRLSRHNNGVCIDRDGPGAPPCRGKCGPHVEK